MHSPACIGAAVGRANFGFVSKYQKGATVPTGQTEFRFSAGSFNFHSENYQWLVIAGSKAQYKGTGTINGQTGYSFLLTATDGDLANPAIADTFRIKIWRTVDATETPVYDNRTDQQLGGGSIVIHK